MTFDYDLQRAHDIEPSRGERMYFSLSRYLIHTRIAFRINLLPRPVMTAARICSNGSNMHEFPFSSLEHIRIV